MRTAISQERLKQLFDYVDGDLVWKVYRSVKAVPGQVAGSVNARGHINVQADGKMYALHQLVYLYHHGMIPEEIDHIDRNKLNNRIENLRPCTSSQNKGNIQLLSNNVSGYRGVSLNSRSQKWHAQIKIHGKQTYLGRFDTPREAAVRYNEAAVKHFGEFAFLNPV